MEGLVTIAVEGTKVQAKAQVAAAIAALPEPINAGIHPLLNAAIDAIVADHFTGTLEFHTYPQRARFDFVFNFHAARDVNKPIDAKVLAQRAAGTSLVYNPDGTPHNGKGMTVAEFVAHEKASGRRVAGHH